MNFLRKLKNRKGFTLVELIVVIALIAIIVVCVAAFSTPVTNIVNNSRAKSDTLTVNKIIGDYIERRLAFAETVIVYDNCDVESPSTAQCGETSLNDKFSFVTATAPKDVGGALIFRYEKNDDEPFKSTYKVYDVPAVSGVSLANYKEYAVFDDAFYGDYQYFVNLDKETVSSFFKVNGKNYDGSPIQDADDNYLYNRGKDKFYMGFELVAYNIPWDAGVSMNGIWHNADTENKASIPGLGEMTNPFLRYQVGKENVSFHLNNVKRDMSATKTHKAVPADTTRYKVCGVPYESNNAIGWDEKVNQQGDVVVFYYVKHYDLMP